LFGVGVYHEVDVGDIEDVLGWVGHYRHGEIDRLEEGEQVRPGAIETGLALREQANLVEQLEGLCGWLMNARDHQDVVASGKVSKERYDLEAGCRVEAARRLIQVEDFRAGDQLRGNADSTLLASTEAFLQGCANECVTLVLQAERLNKMIHSMLQLVRGNSARERKLC